VACLDRVQNSCSESASREVVRPRVLRQRVLEVNHLQTMTAEVVTPPGETLVIGQS